MGFGVEGVTEANLTSDEFVACMFQHSWGGLVCQPLVREFASFEGRRTGLKEQGCVPGSEAVSHRLQFAGRGGERVGEGRGEGGGARGWNFTWDGPAGRLPESWSARGSTQNITFASKNFGLIPFFGGLGP